MDKSTYSKALSWDEVAEEYDNRFGSGRPARTLPLDTVFDKLAELDEFHVDNDEGTIHKIN